MSPDDEIMPAVWVYAWMVTMVALLAGLCAAIVLIDRMGWLNA